MRIARFVVALMLVGAPVAAETAGKAVGKPASVLGTDRRLDPAVSITERRVYLGDLLERLGKASGARIEVDERLAPLSGMELTLSVRDLSVRDVMDGIVDLYSCPPDRWYWERDRGGGWDRYLLHSTLTPARMKAWQQELTETALLKQFHDWRAFDALPTEERNRLAATDPHYRRLNSPSAAQTRAMFTPLTDAQLLGILRGQPVVIPSGELTGAQRGYLQSQMDAHNQAMRDLAAKFPQTTKYTERTLSDVHAVTIDRSTDFTGQPTIGLNAEGFRITSLLPGEGIGTAFSEHLRNYWVQDGENQEPMDVVLTPQPPAPPKPGRVSRPLRYGVEDSLLRIAEIAHVNLFHDCRREAGQRVGGAIMSVPHDGKLASIFLEFPYRGLAWKRRPGYLFVRSMSLAIADGTDLTPWPVTRDLRAHALSNQGFPLPVDLITFARLSPQQRANLADEFAAADRRFSAPDPTLISLLIAVSGMTNEERAAIGDAKGAGWDAWGNPTRERLISLLGREAAQNSAFYFHWDPEHPAEIRWGKWPKGEKPRWRVDSTLRWRDYPREDPPRVLPPGAPMPPLPPR